MPMPLSNPRMLQFLTVTPDTLSILTPSPDPSPRSPAESQSKVTPLATDNPSPEQKSPGPLELTGSAPVSFVFVVTVSPQEQITSVEPGPVVSPHVRTKFDEKKTSIPPEGVIPRGGVADAQAASKRPATQAFPL